MAGQEKIAPENPLEKLFNKGKEAVGKVYKGLTALFAKKKKPEEKKSTNKKPDYSKRVDIYAQGQKRKAMMEAAGKK